MEIKTKFNLGDKIIGIRSNHKLQSFVVARVSIFATNGEFEVNYYPSDGNSGYNLDYIDERYCFATEAEALAYIKGEQS